tara:strand:- start:34 stop:1185 length:1152 start_codon:yes stop_codon:yes gene_type:complete
MKLDNVLEKGVDGFNEKLQTYNNFKAELLQLGEVCAGFPWKEILADSCTFNKISYPNTSSKDAKRISNALRSAIENGNSQSPAPSIDLQRILISNRDHIGFEAMIVFDVMFDQTVFQLSFVLECKVTLKNQNKIRISGAELATVMPKNFLIAALGKNALAPVQRHVSEHLDKSIYERFNANDSLSSCLYLLTLRLPLSQKEIVCHPAFNSPGVLSDFEMTVIGLSSESLFTSVLLHGVPSDLDGAGKDALTRCLLTNVELASEGAIDFTQMSDSWTYRLARQKPQFFMNIKTLHELLGVPFNPTITVRKILTETTQERFDKNHLSTILDYDSGKNIDWCSFEEAICTPATKQMQMAQKLREKSKKVVGEESVSPTITFNNHSL